MTFKILYNGSIANTGAQVPTGAKSVADLTRLLSIEGVKKIAVITKDPGAYRRQQLGAAAVVYPVHESERAMRDLEQTHGTTVYLYDGMCANERRRQQKRGKLPIPNEFVVINQDVCENCGHCGALTNCMSLHKVPTEHGEKTQIHTSSCNLDYSCLGGDCPSFLTVQTKEGTGYRKPRPPRLEAEALPEPPARPTLDQPYHVYIPGVGGTGVITINALLCYAALMDGKRVLSYDQTGAAQKWGPVLSSLVIADADGREGNGDDHRAVWANKVGIGKADLYLAFDVMAGASRANLDRCDPTRTAALVNTSLLPSGEMVRDVNYAAPVEPMRDRIAEYTDPARTVYVGARQHAEALFADYMTTNMFALGSAYQAGLLPLTSESIEGAIRLNGVQVEQNLQAFRYGRLEVVDPARIRVLAEPPKSTFQRERGLALARLRGPSRQAYVALLGRCDHLDDESRRLLAVRIAELIEYQHPEYPQAYVDAVLDVATRDRAMPGEPALTHAVIRNLYKLLAYKDEYEVARLHLKAARRAQTRDLFAEPRKVSYQLHPPLLRAIGLKRKVKLGPWFDPALRVMRDLRGLRGTPLDPFGRAHVRQVERSLVTWYRDLLALTLDHLSPATYPTAVEIAELPDAIRGYEEIKLRNVKSTKARAEALVRRLTEPNPSEVATTVGI